MNTKRRGLSWIETLVVLAVIGLMGLAVPSVRAQTTLESTNIFQSAELFFADNPTNLSWIGNKVEIETTLAYQQQVQFANALKGGYNLNDNWQVGAKIENAGIAGTVESYQASISFALINEYAIKLEVGAEPGYNREYASAVIEPFAAFKKKLTENTYTVVEISEPCFLEHTKHVPSMWEPAVYVGAGFTYGGVSANGTQTSFRMRFDHSMTAFRHFISPSTKL